jgi:hypothetical protein
MQFNVQISIHKGHATDMMTHQLLSTDTVGTSIEKRGKLDFMNI